MVQHNATHKMVALFLLLSKVKYAFCEASSREADDTLKYLFIYMSIKLTQSEDVQTCFCTFICKNWFLPGIVRESVTMPDE
jgi:hypothetical protein